ncbi:hypothetical protein DXG01_009815, partial [Tephrocybe rancida]
PLKLNLDDLLSFDVTLGAVNADTEAGPRTPNEPTGARMSMAEKTNHTKGKTGEANSVMAPPEATSLPSRTGHSKSHLLGTDTSPFTVTGSPASSVDSHTLAADPMPADDTLQACVLGPSTPLPDPGKTFTCQLLQVGHPPIDVLTDDIPIGMLPKRSTLHSPWFPLDSTWTPHKVLVYSTLIHMESK